MNTKTRAQAVRVRHYQGERLTASDLQAEFDNLTWLRGMHVIALHDTWGIALGFEVTLDAKGGIVVVGPGLGYDAYGRELILASSHAVPGPALYMLDADVDGDYELVMCYDTGLGHDVPEQPGFGWRRKGEMRLGAEVPLVGVSVKQSLFDPTSWDLLVRRYAQPQARPHIAAGTTPREQVWRAVSLPGGEFNFAGLETTVDTSAAGFIGAPYYLADLKIDPNSWTVNGVNFLSNFRGAFFTSVRNPTATSFDFRLIPGVVRDVIGIAATDAQPAMSTAATTRSSTPTFYVSWMGIEPMEGCAPPARFDFVLRDILQFHPIFTRQGTIVG